MDNIEIHHVDEYRDGDLLVGFRGNEIAIKKIGRYFGGAEHIILSAEDFQKVINIVNMQNQFNKGSK